MNAQVAGMILKCNTGSIAAHIGDRFEVRGAVLEIVNLSDSGGCWVTCRPTGRAPAWLTDRVRTDGTVDFTSDAVASALLTRRDGKARDPRGNYKNGAKKK